MEMTEETRLVGYADGVVGLIAARTIDLAHLKLNIVMRKICIWMAAHRLTLALDKTDVVVLAKKRIPTIMPLRDKDVTIETKPGARYLGVWIECRMNLWEQIRRTADNDVNGTTALCRLMINVGGPKSSRRRLSMTAIQSVLLYGAEVWANSLNKKKEAAPKYRDGEC